jgi:hypothetical protein
VSVHGAALGVGWTAGKIGRCSWSELFPRVYSASPRWRFVCPAYDAGG